MEYFGDYALFLAKTLTLIAAIVAVIAMIAAAAKQSQHTGAERLDIESLHGRLDGLAEVLGDEVTEGAARKARIEERKRRQKSEAKAIKLGDGPVRSRLFVIDFDGDVSASDVDALREEVTAIVQVANSDDRVLLRLESPGGVVHGYGLAASQLARFKQHGIHLIAAVAKVAASGGYMMACVADEIVAAPFAIIGSIGVVAQMPNFHRLLEANNIDYELHTAGQHKRTLTLFGENTDEDRAKFQEELNEAHDLFKDFIREHRPTLDLDQVATGEHWFGTKALDLGLIDSIRTSDDYLLDARKERRIYRVAFKPKQSLQQKLAGAVDGAADGVLRAIGKRQTPLL